MTSIPSIVYKYRNVPQAKDILERRRVVWSSPLRFNDPFDVQWDPTWVTSTEAFREKFKPAARQMYAGAFDVSRRADPVLQSQLIQVRDYFSRLNEPERSQMLEKEIESACQSFGANWRSTQRIELLRKIRLFCVSGPATSLLLWSHYADQHRGVAIGLRTDVLERGWNSKPLPVKYCDDLPAPLSIDDFVEAYTSDGSLPIREEIASSLTLCKAKCWGYEEEYRFRALSSKIDDDDITFRELHPNAIDHIILGCRMLEEDRRYFRGAVSGNLGHIKLLECNQSRARFGLDLSDYH